MKKILCLIDGLGYGGAERQMIGLAVMLRQKGCEVDMATYCQYVFDTESLDNSGVRLNKLNPSSSKLVKLWLIWKLINRNKYDIVIAYKDGPTVIGCLLKMMGAPFKLIVSERNTTQKVTIKERVKWWLYQYADNIVPNSHTQESFIKYNYPSLKEKVFVITNFTDLDYFRPKEKDVNQTLTILTVARIAKQKNVMNYLEAVRRVKELGIKVVFKWIGNSQIGQSAYANECMEKVKTMGIESVFSFHAATKNIRNEYQQCDIFCLPSVYEGFPNALCEGMSCGKVVLCSSVCDNPYIVKDGENGYLFNPNSVDDIVAMIVKLCQLPGVERMKMGERSREIAEKIFSKEVFIDKYLSLINS